MIRRVLTNFYEVYKKGHLGKEKLEVDKEAENDSVSWRCVQNKTKNYIEKKL